MSANFPATPSGNNNQLPFANMPRSGASGLFGASHSDMSLSPYRTGTLAAHMGCPTRSIISFPNMSLDPFRTGTSTFHIAHPNRAALAVGNRGTCRKITASNTVFGDTRNQSIGQQVGGASNSWYRPQFVPSVPFVANPTSPFTTGVDISTGRAALPNCVLPSVNELLNPHPPFSARTNQERIFETNQLQNSDPSPGNDSQSPRLSTATPSSSSGSSEHTILSSDCSQPLTHIVEHRYSLLVALYRICLEAAARYTHSIRQPLGRNRVAHNPALQGARGDRYHPYSQRSLVPPQWRSHRTQGGGEQTLMDYISVICTWLWRRARTDLRSPHGAEGAAVRDMRNLYDWSEALVEHVENHDPGNEEGEDENGSELMGNGINSLIPGDTDQMAVDNARQLCRYFRDREARISCERLCLELGDLAREAVNVRESYQ